MCGSEILGKAFVLLQCSMVAVCVHTNSQPVVSTGAQANNCILNLTNSAAALRLHVVACCTLNLFISCIHCNDCLQGTQSRV